MEKFLFGVLFCTGFAFTSYASYISYDSWQVKAKAGVESCKSLGGFAERVPMQVRCWDKAGNRLHWNDGTGKWLTGSASELAAIAKAKGL